MGAEAPAAFPPRRLQCVRLITLPSPKQCCCFLARCHRHPELPTGAPGVGAGFEFMNGHLLRAVVWGPRDPLL